MHSRLDPDRDCHFVCSCEHGFCQLAIDKVDAEEPDQAPILHHRRIPVELARGDFRLAHQRRFIFRRQDAVDLLTLEIDVLRPHELFNRQQLFDVEPAIRPAHRHVNLVRGRESCRRSPGYARLRIRKKGVEDVLIHATARGEDAVFNHL